MSPRAARRPAANRAPRQPATTSRPKSRGRQPAWRRDLGPAEAYRVLSYYFHVRSNREPLAAIVRDVLGRFAVSVDMTEYRNPPTPGMPPEYAIVSRAGAGARHVLLYNGQPLIEDDANGAVAHFLWHVNTEAMRRTGDFLILHAGSVTTPAGEAVLLPAPSGSGKTALVTALVRAGFGYLSDEAGPIDPVGRLVYPYPKALTFKPGLAEVFPALAEHRDGEGVWHVSADRIRPGAFAAPAPLRFVVAPEYRRGAPPTLTPLSKAAAVVLLFRNAVNHSLYRSRALRLLAEMIEPVRAYRLVSGDLDGSVAAIRTLTDPEPLRAGRVT